jgi:hypothetical protein
MKHWKKSLVFGVAALLLVASAVPALAAPRADTVDLQVQNRTGASVQLTLKGPTDTTVSVPGLQTKVQLVPGEYTYVYAACGHTIRGTFIVNSAPSPLVLRKCANALTSTFTISNRTGNPFILRLTGKQTYSFWIGNGKTEITLLVGGYQFSSNACGANEKGKFKASTYRTTPWVFDCN